MLAAPKGLEVLAQHGQLAVIDTSFELTELGLVLVTVLVHVAGVLVPASWFVTDMLSAPNLEWFLRYVQVQKGGDNVRKDKKQNKKQKEKKLAIANSVLGSRWRAVGTHVVLC